MELLRDELAPEDNEDTGVREEDFSLESLDMLRVIGTGTFARVCLCQVSGKVYKGFCKNSIKIETLLNTCDVSS